MSFKVTTRIETVSMLAPSPDGDSAVGALMLYFLITAMGGPYSDLGLPTTKIEIHPFLRSISYKLPRADCIGDLACPQQISKLQLLQIIGRGFL